MSFRWPGDGDHFGLLIKTPLVLYLKAFCNSLAEMLMSLGELFLESLSTGVITNEEMDWITTHQRDFSRLEEATAIKLGRFLDRGIIHIGCRVNSPIPALYPYKGDLKN